MSFLRYIFRESFLLNYTLIYLFLILPLPNTLKLEYVNLKWQLANKGFKLLSSRGLGEDIS